MVKSINTKAGPNILEVLEVLGLVPPSRLGLLLCTDRHQHRNQLKRDGPLIPPSNRRRSLEEAAKILRTTVSRIKRLLRVARNQPDSLPYMKWGSGRKRSRELTAE